MLSTFGSWLVEQILSYLLKLAVKSIETTVNQIEEDKKRGQVNEANQKAYEEAQDRASRIQAALNLLDRSTP